MLKYHSGLTFLPGVSPGVSRSTIKPLNALLAGHLGSGLVRANTKYLKHDFLTLMQEREKTEDPASETLQI